MTSEFPQLIFPGILSLVLGFFCLIFVLKVLYQSFFCKMFCSNKDRISLFSSVGLVLVVLVVLQVRRGHE